MNEKPKDKELNFENQPQVSLLKKIQLCIYLFWTIIIFIIVKVTMQSIS